MPPARHLLELAVYLLFISSPVPLAIFFTSTRIPSNRKAPWASYFFSVISVWLILQTFITLSLGTLRLLNIWALAGIHSIILICGAFILWRQKGLKGRLFPKGSSPTNWKDEYLSRSRSLRSLIGGIGCCKAIYIGFN